MMQVSPCCSPAVPPAGDTGAGDKERGPGARGSILLRGHSQLSIGSQAGNNLTRAKEDPVSSLPRSLSSRKYVW